MPIEFHSNFYLVLCKFVISTGVGWNFQDYDENRSMHCLSTAIEILSKSSLPRWIPV